MKESGYIIFSPNCYFDIRGGRIIDQRNEPVRLSILPQRALMALLDNEGKVVSKDILISLIWKEDATNTSEQSLTNLISILRHTAKDIGDSIRTVRGVGYILERDKINDVKQIFVQNAHDEQEKRSLLEKYLNRAVLDRIAVLEAKIKRMFDEVIEAKRLQLDNETIRFFQRELDESMHEHALLKEDLYSEFDIDNILQERFPDVLTDSLTVEKDSNVSLCASIAVELSSLESRIVALKQLQDLVC